MKNFNNKLFQFKGDFQIVNGFNRALVFNPVTNKMYFIPNFIGKIIIDEKYYLDYGLIMSKLNNNEEIELFNYFINFFFINNLMFEITEKEKNYFNIYNTRSFEMPNKISNAIIDDFFRLDFTIFEKVVSELDSLGCTAILLRVFDKMDFDRLIEGLELISKSNISNIEIIIPNEMVKNEDEKKRLLSVLKLIKIILYTSEINEIEYLEERRGVLTYTTDNLNSSLCCGVISQHYFNLDFEHFAESQLHNTCLNRKIAIDFNGDIKNCPSMKNNFGNIRDTSLNKVIKNNAFNKLWNIKKDEITTCKDCEFRHICTDCRAYLENPKDIYSKPLKCGYNPYTNEWEEWSTHPLKQKAIDWYGMREILPKSEN